MGKNKSESAYHTSIRRSLRLNTELVRTSKSFNQETPMHVMDQYQPVILFVLDYRTKSYSYLNTACESILGLERSEVYLKGLDLVTSLLHEQDRPLVDQALSEYFLKMVREISDKDLPQYRFSFNYRIKRKDNQYIQFLYQFRVVMRDKENYPVLIVGNALDVSSIQKDNHLNFQISRYDPDSKTFTTIDKLIEAKADLPISDRELQIVKYIARGHTNQEIASMEGLSIFTVKAHRRNILKKTNSHNFQRLIEMANRQGWI